MPTYWERHSIGATMGATVLAALVLSILPLPEALQPFPALRANPATSLRATLWPTRTKEQPQPEGPEGAEPAEGVLLALDAPDFLRLVGAGGPLRGRLLGLYSGGSSGGTN